MIPLKKATTIKRFTTGNVLDMPILDIAARIKKLPIAHITPAMRHNATLEKSSSF